MDENHVRRRLLEIFRDNDPDRSYLIHASQFKEALTSLGLEFGTEIVSNIVMLCEIDDNGYVKYKQLADNVMNVEKEERSFEEPIDDISAKGFEFQHAIQEERGDTYSSAPYQDFPQPERVQKLSGELHKIYQDYDAGRNDLTVLRARLSDLAFIETPEFLRVMRQSGFSFKSFIRSLMANESLPLDKRAGVRYHKGEPKRSLYEESSETADFEFGSRPRRTETSIHMNRSTDVVTWREMDGRPVPEGTDTTFQSAKGRHVMPSESGGVRDALRGHKQRPLTSYVTETTASQAEGRKVAAPPALVGLPSQELQILKEKVYSVVRQLDEGFVNSRQFKERMRSLGVDLPLAVLRLLAEHDSHGSAKFRDFVIAFEDFFNEKAKEYPDERPKDEMPMDSDDSMRLEGAIRRRLQPAALNSRDILTWKDVPKSADSLWGNIHGTGRAHVTPAFNKKLALYHDSTNPLQWGGEGSKAEASEMLPSGRRRSRQHIAQYAHKATTDILAWDGKAVSQTPESFRPQKRRMSQPSDTPFGTEVDVVSPMVSIGRARADELQPSTDRKRTKALFDLPDSGEWFKPVRQPPLPHM